MNKQAYYSMMKMASLLKAAADKKKPYSALDVDTSKDDYHWPSEKDPQIGTSPYDRGGYFRQLGEFKGMNESFVDALNKTYQNSLDDATAVKPTPGRGLYLLRREEADDAASNFAPRSSLPNSILQKAFRQSGDIKHKHWLKTNKIRPVSPDLITVPGFKDIFKAATPEDKNEIRHHLKTISKNKGKGHGNVV